MPINVLIGPTIAAGTSLSNALNINAGLLYRIIMPALWTPAKITFQLSQDGIDFYDAYGLNGKEIVLQPIRNTIVTFGGYIMQTHSIKIRSGTTRVPVVQTLPRVFKLVIDTQASVLPAPYL